jgi:hypothetical protein
MTKVIFRKFANGEIIALFPNEKDYMCDSYMHIGQHSDADYPLMISKTKPATEKEYKPLLDELVKIGYDDLKIYKRKTNKKH